MAFDPHAERVRLVIEPTGNEPGATASGGDSAGQEDMIDLGRLEEEPEYDFEDEEESLGRRRLLPIGLAVLALAGFGAISWYAYQTMLSGNSDEAIPLIMADAGPIKTRPAAPGGMEVPYRDKLVLNQISPDPDKPQVERLLPPQEVPKPPVMKAESLAQKAPAIPAETMAQAPAAAAPTVPAPVPAPTAPAAKAIPEIAAAGSGNSGGDLAPATGPEKVMPAAPAAAPKPPAAAPEATQTAAVVGGYLVQLASLKDKGLVGGEWDRLRKALPELLAEKKLVLQEADLGTKGKFHRIRVGYFVDRASAAALCQAIKAKSQACIVVKP